eukprot:6540683-Alexandrium_andersonii.AAC.1
MSASLVGSEMCIRDRPLTATCGVSGRASRPTTRSPHRLGGHLHPGAHPVSYTHLTLPTICSV